MAEALLVILGGVLTLAGGYLSDLRAAKREVSRVTADRITERRVAQREAVADVLVAADRFRTSSDVLGLRIMASTHRDAIEFVNLPEVDKHGPVVADLARALARARLVMNDRPRTAAALDTVLTSQHAIPEAWGPLITPPPGVRRPLPVDTVAPMLRAQGAFKRATTHLMETAGAELVES